MTNTRLAILTTCLMLLLVEGFFALTYESRNLYKALLTYQETPQTRALTPPLNAQGFRQKPVPPEAMGGGVTRILFLGDSFTFGDGLPDGEKRFTDLIGAQLDARTDKQRYFVYNAGMSGTEPTRWVGYLQKLLPVYKPDIVYAVFFLRDGTGIGTSLGGHLPKIRGLNETYADNLFYRHSAIARVLLDYFMVEEFNRYYQNLYFSSYLGTPAQTTVWKKEQASILRLAELCRKHRVDFHLIIFPALFDLKQYPYLAVEQEITRFAMASGIPVMSLIEGFAGANEQELWISKVNQHPNEKGHRIAADTLYPYVLRTLGLTP